MSNSIAALTVTMSYPAPGGGGAAQSKTFQKSCPFQGESIGIIDVPALEAMTTTHAIPFGSIAKATLVVIQNRTGQDLSLKINGSLALQDVPDGGVAVFGHEALGTAADLTDVSLITTAAQGATPGYIDYFVFGDPV